MNFLAGTGGTGAFLDGMGNRLKMIAVPLNETGWAEVTYFMGTNQGDNFIYIVPPAPLSPSLIDIVGIGNSRPFFIFQSVTLPDGLPFIPTGTSAQAVIDYQLLDQWGNPSTDQGIQIVTSAGENKIFYTNQEGHATILYGPKLSAGFYSITATAVANFSVSISQTLQFRGLEPKDMLLTASPQTMASLDVPNATKLGHVYAKVIDERGNPVYGQNVTFAIGISDSSPFNRTGDPAIGIGAVTTSDVGSPLSAVTDENGQAVLDYYPGEFPILGKLGYSEIAQGMTTINALWTDPDGRTVNRSIDLSYKNYRFLSVYTEVNPKTVQTGALVDVSVRLKGDGWALQPKPIDVVLCTDRSATMLNNESISTSGTLVRESVNDRMVDAMNAAIAFVSQTTARDRIGLVTFGKPLGGVALLYDTGDKPLDKNKDPGASRAGRDYACQLDQSCTILANDSTDDKAYVRDYYTGHGPIGRDYRVNGDPNVYVESPLDYQNDHKEPITGAIKSIVPAGGTPMRRAIYRSVKQIIDNPRDEAVKAIILLTDGKWGYTGDPRGIVTTGIFGSIESYPEVAAGPQGPGTGSVITWAKDKGIKIFTIALVGKDTADQPNVAELKAYADETGGKPYVADANKEKTDEALWSIYTMIAGELRETVSVDTQVALDFRDVEVNGTYTLPGNQTFNYEFIDGRSTYIIPPAPAKPKTLNNTEDWVTGQRFNIAAGNITVNDEWVVKFTLRALTEGNIKVLSSKSSKVTFTGIGGEVGIPDTYITAMPPGTEKGPEEIACSFENLWRTNEATNTQLVELSWDPVYNGHQPKINWTVGVGSSYSYAPYQWQDPFGWYSYDTKVTYPLIIKDLKPGNYVVKVIGRVSDASSDCTGPDYPLTIPEPAVTPQILIR
ncbi:MAG: VWA domain-containing protein [Methanomicrobiales archaeon]|nr:VWA domain-containing protein [Methanomicrobiales archaeon]